MSQVKNKKNKKEDRRPQGTIKRYCFGAIGLVVLISTAFLVPRLLLELQDNLRCGKIVLTEAEEMDITSFNTGYEKNLYKRLFRFAKELDEGQQFYVGSQEVDDTEEIEDFLKSENGLYQDKFWMWLDIGIVPDDVLIYLLRQCRQYVIYGDDFSDGMNFLLWYVELGEEGQTILKLLIDAETGDFYGICLEESEDALARRGYTVTTGEYNLEDCFQMQTDGDMLDLWFTFAYYYGGLKESEIFQNAEKYGYDIYASEGEIYALDAYIETPYNSINSDFDYEKIGKVLEQLKWELSEDRNRIDFLFPYGRNGEMEDGNISELRFRLEADWAATMKDKNKYYKLKTFLAGFPEIYERIPEFSE